MESTSLQKLSMARNMLIEAKNLDDVLKIRDIAEAARVYAQAAKLGLESQNEAAEIKLRAERKAGELLAQMPKNEGAKGKIIEHLTGGSTMEPPDDTPTLAELGIAKTTSHRWQTIARLPEEEFEEHISNIKESGKELTSSDIYQKAKQKERSEIQTEKRSIPLPTGKYAVIYIDPPWPVESIIMDKWESPIEDKYPTMSIDKIKELPIPDLAYDECSLFLWTTHTFLPDALEIIKHWGFKYLCCITWDKGNGWTQFGFHKRTEFLLYAYRGGININQYGEAIPTIISEKKTFHSKKPDMIRTMIQNKTPEPRLEMFARDKYMGWDAWGNEVNNG